MNSIAEDVPDGFQSHYDGEKYAKSQTYLKDNTRFGLLSSTFSLALTLIVIHTGLFGILDHFVRAQTGHPILGGLLFFGIIFIINDIINLPFSLYGTFVIEEKYGFNKTTAKTYTLDKLKGYALTVILGSIVIVPILYFFNTYGENGWWIAWLLVTGFMIAVQPLFVHVIAPMFNKFTPLEDGELRTAIEAFSEKVNFPIARKTPHIYLFDEKDKLVYSGAIDDNARKPRKVKHTFLADAMDALLTGEKIDPVSTKALGCSIKFK
jgi:STE24 endopeptidase